MSDSKQSFLDGFVLGWIIAAVLTGIIADFLS